MTGAPQPSSSPRRAGAWGWLAAKGWLDLDERHPWLLALLVLLLALIARLWRIDLAQFSDDQATLLRSAAELVQTHRIPVTDGMSFTIGVRHPPLATFLLAVPSLLTGSPVWASAYAAALDAAGCLFVYLTGKSVGGRKAGLFAGVLYALEPAALFYGRTIWNPDFVPFFTAVAMFGMVDFWRRGCSWPQGVALLAIGCGSQLHPQMVALLPVWLVLSIWKRRWSWPATLATLVLLISLSPYIWLQFQSSGADLRGALRYLNESKQADWQALAAFVDLFSGRLLTQLQLLRGASLPAFALDPLGAFWCCCLAGSLLLAAIRRRTPELIVASSFLLPILMSIRHSTPIAPHYLLVLLPGGAVLAGLALAALRPAPLGWALVFATSALAAGQYVNFQNAIPEAGPSANYGIPLRYTLAATRVTETQSSTGPVYLANRDEDAGTFPYLLGNRMAVKRFDGRYSFVFPQREALYIADATTRFAGDVLGAVGGSPTATVVTPSGVPVFALFRVSADAAERYDASVALQPIAVDVGHALQLTGYSATGLRAGGQSRAQVAWQVTNAAAATPGELRQFAHLLDSAGVTWSTNEDVRGYPRSQWQTGDAVVSSFDLAIRPEAPTGGYWLETGFYEAVSNRPLEQFRDGAPAGSSTRIGPLKVSGKLAPLPETAQARAIFGDGTIALLAVEQRPGQLQLRWQALRRPLSNYTVFVHVLDGQGHLIAQNDSPPKGGAYPTSLWDQGEVVDDLHTLSFEGAAGESLEIGLYTQPNLQRLPALDVALGTRSDHVTLPLPPA